MSGSAAFVRWTSSHARAHEFCWIEQHPETIMFSAKDLRITPKDPAYQSVRKMMSTIELNPYERELLYVWVPVRRGECRWQKFSRSRTDNADGD